MAPSAIRGHHAHMHGTSHPCALGRASTLAVFPVPAEALVPPLGPIDFLAILARASYNFIGCNLHRRHAAVHTRVRLIQLYWAELCIDAMLLSTCEHRVGGGGGGGV